VGDQVAHHPSASVIAGALTQPESLAQRAERLFSPTRAQALHAVEHPQPCVRALCEALLTKDQHGTPLVTSLGLTPRTLYSGDGG